MNKTYRSARLGLTRTSGTDYTNAFAVVQATQRYVEAFKREKVTHSALRILTDAWEGRRG